MCGGGPEGEIQNGKCSVSGCCNWVFLIFIFQFFNKEHVLLLPAFGSLSSHPPPSGSLPYAGVLRALGDAGGRGSVQRLELRSLLSPSAKVSMCSGALWGAGRP